MNQKIDIVYNANTVKIGKSVKICFANYLLWSNISPKRDDENWIMEPYFSISASIVLYVEIWLSNRKFACTIFTDSLIFD